ncbi:MAG: hypothetical protein ACUVTN_00760 [Thermodesulfobacteriota bacterium]
MKVWDLTQEILSLKTNSLNGTFSPEGLLKIRGIEIFKKNPTDRLLFPHTLSLLRQDRFFEMMKKYSFRLVLRDVIKHQDQFSIEDLTHYCSSKVVKEYCDFLLEIGVIKKKRAGKFQLVVSPIYSFGPTLEWFISEMFKRDFFSPSIYNVSIKKTHSGGDYDVIASWNQKLVYVEVKSSPPKGVELGEVTTFFSRLEDLFPDLAFLFNDTQLRMKDKLVVMVEEELCRRYGKDSQKLFPVERLVEELFHVRHRLYIVNSKKDVVENFKICLRDYLRYSSLCLPFANEELRQEVFFQKR